MSPSLDLRQCNANMPLAWFVKAIIYWIWMKIAHPLSTQLVTLFLPGPRNGGVVGYLVFSLACIL